MVRFLIIDFPQNTCDDDYYIIHFLCGNNMSLHCSMLSTRCIKATVPSIRYFNWQNNQVAFSSDKLAIYATRQMLICKLLHVYLYLRLFH